MSDRIGELLVQKNLLTVEQLERAHEEAKISGSRVGLQLTKLGYIQEDDLAEAISSQYGVPTITLADFDVDADVIKLIPEEVAQKHTILPVNRAGATLIIATADPANIFAIDDVKFLTGYNVEVVVAAEESIRRAIEQYYDTGDSLDDVMADFDDDEFEVVSEADDVDPNDLEKSAEDAPVVKLVNLILTDAIKKIASDIHIEPYEKSFRVRYRIDGVLYEVMNPPRKLKNPLTSRVKIMADLDIAERRLPQDGRIKLKVGRNKEMDYRVSCLPTLFGEKIVLRLLDKSNLQLDMT
ncbi:MAG: Flp pilus assembly complex ATPase component TadA, partial [Deltaproteobacteria bacterium]|nr:Flp pilus assembly complex ATPase component TadA [Deltaproteobacteria bacterium]